MKVNLKVLPKVLSKFGKQVSDLFSPLLFKYLTGEALSSFSRTSIASYTDASGIVRQAPSGVARTIARVNLLLRSEEFDNAAWTVFNTAVGANAVTSPTGTLTADTLTGTTSTSTGKYISQSNTAAGQLTFSVYAKRGTHDFVQLVQTAHVDAFANFNLSTGTVGTTGTGTTATITSVGDGWYRLTATFSITVTAAWRVYLVDSASATYAQSSTSTNSVHLWGSQLEHGAAARTYISTAASIGVVYDGTGHDYSHYIGGVQTTLLEGARTNVVLWSRDLTNAVWSKVGTVSTAQNAVGLDGTASSASTLTDSDATAIGEWRQTYTVPNDGNAIAYSVWVRKDTDQSRFVMCYAALSAGTTGVTRGVWLNTQTGATTTTNAAGTGTSRVIDAGLWWIVEVTITNNTTGNTALQTSVYAARGTVIGVDNITATGSCVVGQVQVELNAPCSSSPIFTTTAAATRASDNPGFPFPHAPQASTYFVKFVELGTILVSSARVLETSNAGTSPRFLIYAPTNYTPFHNNGTATVVSGGPTPPSLGQTVELRAILYADGSVQIGQTVNGGTEVMSVASGPNALASAWSGQTLHLNTNSAGSSYGFAGFQAVKIASGVKTLAEMRAL